MRKAIIIALVAALALAAAACSSGDDESEAATPAAEDASAGGAAELGGADDAVAFSQPARDGGGKVASAGVRLYTETIVGTAHSLLDQFEGRDDVCLAFCELDELLEARTGVPASER